MLVKLDEPFGGMRPIISADDPVPRIADQLLLVVNDQSIMENGNAGLLQQFAALVPARSFPDNIVALPFSGRFGGIHQGWGLTIERARLAVRVGLVVI